ncbi:MAG: choice-of-anchor tandem repeat GloVer-containing protein [Verrucomicrobiota bacterium]
MLAGGGRKAAVVCAMLGLAAQAWGQMNLQTLWSFGVPGQSAGAPQAPLVQGPDGALYGTTLYGIASSTNYVFQVQGYGTVFKINTDGAGFSVLHYFGQDSMGGQLPRGGLLVGSDGVLYGTTGNGFGTVFKLNPDGTSYATLHTFAYPTGSQGPNAGLIEGQDGALYGMTGGESATLFKLSRDGTSFAILHTFGASEFPCGVLAQDNAGTLYGVIGVYQVTAYSGNVFKINPDGTGYAVLRTLSPGEGGYPRAGLVLGGDGALYGTAPYGGESNLGVVFKLARDGTGFTLLHSFGASGSDGWNPDGGLALGRDGALYGTASSGGAGGCGTVFRITTDGSSFSTLYSLSSGGQDGRSPGSALIQGRDGALYGTTSDGGTGDGTVFKLNTDGSGYTVLERLSLGGGDAYNPGACLLLGSDGRLYGTATTGSDGGGAVYRINRDGTGYAVVRRFSDSTNGWAGPVALLEGADGALYGATLFGGAADAGSVFKMNPDGAGFALLHSFTNNPAGSQVNPNSLVQASDGVLYGTTYSGGAENLGTVFWLNTDGTAFAILHSFGASEAQHPQRGLVQGYEGALYGTTGYQSANPGGPKSPPSPPVAGTVFRIYTDGSGYTLLHTFDSSPTNSQSPTTPLVLGSNGALYAAAWVAGNPDFSSALFTLKPDGSGYALLHGFGGASDGWEPEAALLQAMDGTLFGTTAQGGAYWGAGAVFQIGLDGSDYATRYFFGPGGSASPCTPLVQDRDGVFYGTTQTGGALSLGTVFRLTYNALPEVLAPPQGQIVAASANAAFSVRAWSVSPLAYQWRFNGAILPGATNSSLSLTNVQLDQAGNYDVVVNDAHGSLTSALAGLTVSAPPSCSCAPMNPQIFWSFNTVGTVGTAPQAGLLRGRDGAWYGSTGGSVFKLAPDGTGLRVLCQFGSFQSAAGARLVQGSDGILYGGMSSGLFKLNPDGTGYAVVSGLVWGDTVVEGYNGVLFGLCSGGWGPDPGAVYRMNCDGTGLTVLHRFAANGGDGWNPLSPLARGPDGALYGTTYYGGANQSADYGTVFKLSLDGIGYSLLHSFGQSAGDGQYPRAGVVQGPDGALYGTTYGGGSSNLGTIFKINSSGTAYSVLWSFTTNRGDGCQPCAELMPGNDGALYGTACNGGGGGCGTVFRINPDGTGYSTVYVFAGGQDGRNPVAGLAQAPDGALWGTTPAGGLNDQGTIFKLTCLPVIQVQPASQTVWAGGDATFSAQCGSLTAWGAQWLLNGAPLPGAASPALLLTNVGLADAGNYQLVLTNSCGSVTSAVAVLTVVPGQPPPVAVCTEAALRQAMRQGGHVTFACDGTISLAAAITNLADTVLDATGRQITIRSTNNCGLFYVPKLSLTLLNLTLANGGAQSGAAIFNNGGNVTLEDVRFLTNTVYSGSQPILALLSQGGAIYTRDGVVRATNCVFLGNRLWGASDGLFGGGAICIESGQAILDGCLFSGNTVQADGPYNQAHPAAGGAIHNSGALSVSGCSFLGNSAGGGGNGQFCPSGGALYNLGTMDLARSTFASNTVSGLPGNGGWFGMPGNGSAGGPGACAAGGAVFNAGLARLVNDTFAWNSASGGWGGNGGPADGGSGGDGGNGGSAWGGALCDTNGAVTSLTNCTFASNSATGGPGGGGGMGGDPADPIHWNPSWHEGSPGSNGLGLGGGLWSGGATLINTLLAGNSPADQFADGGHNLESATAAGILGPLADNGGPTLTMALVPGSPAVDAADDASAPPTDQRGVPRLYGAACDVGAFESQTAVRLQSVAGAAGTMHLHLSGADGQALRLLASTNLVDWAPVQTNQIGPDGFLVIEIDPGKQREFYRAELMLPVGGYTIAGVCSPPAGGWVAGEGRFFDGSTVTMVALPQPGYAFVNWTENGALVTASASYTFTAKTARTLTANFAPFCTITVIASPQAAGSVFGGATVVSGSSVTVLATTNTGYAFANWTDNGTVASTSASYTFTVSANRTLTANFIPLDTVTVLASPAAGGVVGGGGVFPSGSSVTVVAAPNPTFVFANWTENGVPLSTLYAYTFTITNNRLLTGNFAPSCTVALSAAPADGGSVSGGGTFLYGSSVTVLAATNTGYAFADWTENGTLVSTSSSYTFAVTNNRALTANFAPARTVSLNAWPAQGGSVAGGGTFPLGASVAVVAATNSGYVFVAWTDNGLPVSRSASYTFTVTTNRVLTANFGPPCTVTLNAAPQDGGPVAGGGTFLYGSSVTVLAGTNSGYAFAGWTENGSPVSASASYTFTATNNRVLTANFGPAVAVSLSASPPEGGSVEGGGPFAIGSIITIEAAPTSGYAFTNWTENGRALTTSPRYTFTVTSNRLFKANFVALRTVNVVTECTEVALRSAIAGGGTVAFAGAGIITLSNAIVITSDTVLDGTASQIAISGQNRAFAVSSNATFTGINLAVACSLKPPQGSFDPGGGILNDGGVLNLRGVSFLTNASVVGGGALANRNGGVVNATNCTFAGNYAGWEWGAPYGPQPLGWLLGGVPAVGGAILNADGQVNLRACLFSGNRAEGGPDDPILSGPAGAGAGSGGAIHNQGNMNVTDCTFSGNWARGGGGFTWLAVYGGNYIGASGTSAAGASGGAICNLGAMALWRSTIVSNSAAGGGGGRGQTGGELNTSSLNWSFSDSGDGGNGGSGSGGGLFNGGTASVVNCTFCANTGAGGAGGWGGSAWTNYYLFEGRQEVAIGAVGRNGLDGSGSGGVCSPNGGLCLTNCTLGFNTASVGTNQAEAVGGLSGPGTVLVNTLLAGNSPGGNAAGPVVDGGHNLSSDASCAFTDPASLSNTDPMPGPLADNGGPTLTLPLLPGSPAVDAANTLEAPPTDQRGFPRPYGAAADIGAYEAMPLYTLALSASPPEGGSVWGDGTFGSGSRVTVLAATSLGYAFVNWTENRAIVSTSATYTFTLAAGRALTANFAPIQPTGP